MLVGRLVVREQFVAACGDKRLTGCVGKRVARNSKSIRCSGFSARSSLMLGVKGDNRELSSRCKQSRFDAEYWVGKLDTRSGGVGEIGRFVVGSNGLRRTTNDDSLRTNFDN
jgi:hypothetical protein